MNIYDYHPTTGAYLSARLARPDPLSHRIPIYEDRETEDGGVERVQIGETGDAWLIPANATPVAPPEPLAGHARVWTGAAWVQVEDHIGARYWTPSAGLATQTALGPLPEGATVVTGTDPDLAFAGGVWRETTEAERAARTLLTPVQLFGELDALLPQHAPTEDYVAAVIGASALDSGAKARALAALRRATLYQGGDPLLLQIGAILGLDADAVVDLVLAAATRESV